MGLRDTNFVWKRKKVLYTPFSHGGIVSADVTGALLVNPAAIAPANSVEMGPSLGLATTHVFDTINLINISTAIPNNLDPKYPVGAVILWTGVYSSGNASSSWNLRYKVRKKGNPLNSFTAPQGSTFSPDIIQIQNYINLDGTFATESDIIQTTNRAQIKDLQITIPQIEAGAHWGFSVGSSKIGGLTSIYFLGLLIDYAPRYTQGTGRQNDPLL